VTPSVAIRLHIRSKAALTLSGAAVSVCAARGKGSSDQHKPALNSKKVGSRAAVKQHKTALHSKKVGSRAAVG